MVPESRGRGEGMADCFVVGMRKTGRRGREKVIVLGTLKHASRNEKRGMEREGHC